MIMRTYLQLRYIHIYIYMAVDRRTIWYRYVQSTNPNSTARSVCLLNRLGLVEMKKRKDRRYC
jgi:hypothetical protein